MNMKLSILNQVPVSADDTSQQALEDAITLAIHADKWGYQRYWVAEHHDLYGLACPNPDVLLGIIGTKTKRIRIGAGAVLLPYYKPYRVAETYNLLATLYPNRVDLGLGRSPGGAAEVSLALSDDFLAEVRDYPNQITELIDFLYNRFPSDATFGKIRPTPVPEIPPIPWVLGTSEKSALLAAEKGLHYTFGHFMSDADGAAIVQMYRKQFEPHSDGPEKPYIMIGVNVVCAETTEEAEDLALSGFLWKIKQDDPDSEHTVPTVEAAKSYPYTEKELEKLKALRNNTIVGTPEEVKRQLLALQAQYEADEYMVVTITHDAKAKEKSYQLLAEVMK